MRVESLTFFRFIAAIIVVCFHFGRETHIPAWFGDISVSGAQMVTLFFVLSGFVMFISHDHKPNQPVMDYYINRLARVAPVYLLALASFAFMRLDIIGILLSATFTQAWFSPYPLRPNVPGWSLSVEMFFYLLFPWILHLIKHYRLRASALLIFSLIFYVLTQAVMSRLIQPDIYQGEHSLTHDLIFFFPLSHLCSFLLGIAGGKFFLENQKFFHSQSKIQLALCFGSLTLVYFALNNQASIFNLLPFPVALGSSFFSPMFLLMILGVASSQNLLTSLLSKPLFIFLGSISYSLYIIQFPLYIFFVHAFSSYLNSRGTLFFLVYLFALILISAAVYRFCEIPCKTYLLQCYHRRYKKSHLAGGHAISLILPRPA